MRTSPPRARRPYQAGGSWRSSQIGVSAVAKFSRTARSIPELTTPIPSHAVVSRALGLDPAINVKLVILAQVLVALAHEIHDPVGPRRVVLVFDCVKNQAWRVLSQRRDHSV